MTGLSSPPVADEAHSNSKLIGEAAVRGPKWARMPLLTVSMLGLQVVWSMEMAWASPYLHDELGVKKSLVAIVFLAGPISGLVVQPFIGVLADRSTSRFGRRRPYIVGGGLITILGVFLLGFTRFFSGIITTDGSNANKVLTVILAVFSIFFIDFSINAVQAADRALLVDVLPTEDQPLGNAWAAGMFGVGSVLTFFLGSVHLPKYLPFLGDTQLKVLAALASIAFILVHGILSYSVREQQLLPDTSNRQKTSFISIFKDIWINIRSLPYVIQQICLVQFFAWIAWFPVLFYMTIYISELYTQNFDHPTLDQDNEGTRLGNRALFLNAICSLVTSIVAPIIVKEKGKYKRWGIIDLGMLWAISLMVLSICLLSTFFIKSVGGTTFLSTLIGFAWAITQWAPFALLGEAILSTPPSTRGHRNSIASVESIYFLDRRTRVQPGSMSRSRPAGIPEEEDAYESQFLIGEEDGEESIPIKNLQTHAPDARGGNMESDSESDNEPSAPPSRGLNGLMSNDFARRSDVFHKPIDIESGHGPGDHQPSEDGLDGAEMQPLPPLRRGLPRKRAGGEENLSAKAGIILGIHNVAIVIPQFLSTALSSIIFAIYEPHRSILKGPHPAPAQGPAPVNGTTTAVVETMEAVATLLFRRQEGADDSSPDSLGVVFRIGGICAFVASMVAWRLYRLLRTHS